MNETETSFETVPFPAIREASIDLLRAAHGKRMIHAVYQGPETMIQLPPHYSAVRQTRETGSRLNGSEGEGCQLST